MACSFPLFCSIFQIFNIYLYQVSTFTVIRWHQHSDTNRIILTLKNIFYLLWFSPLCKTSNSPKFLRESFISFMIVSPNMAHQILILVIPCCVFGFSHSCSISIWCLLPKLSQLAPKAAPFMQKAPRLNSYFPFKM